MDDYGTCHRSRSFTSRKVSSAIDDNPLIPTGKPLFLTLGLLRWVTAIVAPLDHQGRDAEPFRSVDLSALQSITGVQRFRLPAMPIAM
jgi:hypothetical protein